ncbi:MAG: metal ABC transporter permease [Candidatus Coproplasma sp.]
MNSLQEILNIFITLRVTIISALIAGVFVSISSSLLGVTLVLKRFSLIGDGLSHVAFGAMCISAVVGLTDNLFIVMPVTIVAAVLLMCFGQKTIKGDTMIAMISVGALALGYVLMNMFPVSGNVSSDVCTTLFGSSLSTLTATDVWSCAIMSALVALVFILFYNKIFAVTFDEKFMQVSGGHAKAYNVMLSVLTGVVISLSMRIVGSLLITALIIFPTVSAMRIFKSYKGVTVFAVCYGVVTSVIGIILSILLSAAAGSMIVLTEIVFFVVCFVVGKIRGRAQRKA